MGEEKSFAGSVRIKEKLILKPQEELCEGNKNRIGCRFYYPRIIYSYVPPSTHKGCYSASPAPPAPLLCLVRSLAACGGRREKEIQFYSSFWMMYKAGMCKRDSWHGAFWRCLK